MYQLVYLPIAKQDMMDIMLYISHELCNPSAAENLASEMIESANRLTEFPYSNAIYRTIEPLEREFRKLIVQNYIMFYWVGENEKQVTIARVIYAHRDYKKLL